MPMPASDPSPDHQTPLRIEVALAPALLAPGVPRGETVFIVVDVIRATTSLCVLFERDAAAVLVAPDIEMARALAPEIDASLDVNGGPRVFLAGEVGGARPDGFDYGNSPAELARTLLRGRSVLFATTNGTRAIRACAGGRAILAGALRNAQAVAAAALDALPSTSTAAPASSADAGADEDQHFDILIVCSGRGDQPAYDDTICTGYILRRLMEAAAARGRPVALESGAQIALATLAGVEAGGGIRAALAQSGAYQAIARIGLAGDLNWCAATDVTAVVPRVVEYLPGHDLYVMRARDDASQG
ncbi:MAG TPA: 2-phosphosulfolactate phosphatase [Ktedonobacterales bacterium]|nr:2-phosphosulfolactate phosphatase [Ktedonobacterales bacterium]